MRLAKARALKFEKGSDKEDEFGELQGPEKVADEEEEENGV